MKRYDRLPKALPPDVADRARVDMLDWLAGGPATVAELGRAVGVTPQQAATVVATLHESGEIRRYDPPEDLSLIVKYQLPGWAA